MMKTKHCPHCGTILGKPRSPKAHRHFFKLIELAFLNWPGSHRFNPDSSEHLRAWLLVSANYRDVIHDDPARPRVEFITDVIRRTRETGYAFPAVHGDGLAIAFPRSINWDTLDQREFSPIAEAVYAIIEKVIGVDIETLKKEAKETL
jgi:hypothetical protein